MNLFFLHWNAAKNAQMHIDKHVGKMIVEITQMLYSAWHMLQPGGDWIKKAPLTQKGARGYRLNHKNHPMSVWVRSSKHNYKFAITVALELGKEFEKRYNHPHASVEHVKYLSTIRPPCKMEISTTAKYGNKGLRHNVTPVPLCMPEEHYDDDPIKAYKSYYNVKIKTLSTPKDKERMLKAKEQRQRADKKKAMVRLLF